MTKKQDAKVVPILGEPAGAWVFDGDCGDADPELFFSSDGKDWTQAKKYCVECPVRKSCLSYALRTKQLHGTWGGADQVELRKLLQLDAYAEVSRNDVLDLRCPYCRKGKTLTVTEPEPKTSEPEVIECASCKFSWERVHVKRRGRKKSA